MDREIAVKGFRLMGQTVAFCGMSVSDIKAMFACDVGISFASSSSSAAIDTSDLVCLNDCFDTILSAVI